MKVREMNIAGPCITKGEFVRETAKFLVYRERRSGAEKRIKKSYGVHVEPCTCCTDHSDTQYPHGYMD